MKPTDDQIDIAAAGLASQDRRGRAAGYERTYAYGAIQAMLTHIEEQVLALPEDGANKSRDAGRGYSQAVTDVLAILRGQTP
jgi:hypothetical protein